MNKEKQKRTRALIVWRGKQKLSMAHGKETARYDGRPLLYVPPNFAIVGGMKTRSLLVSELFSLLMRMKFQCGRESEKK
jgi:hypothetical protein